MLRNAAKVPERASLCPYEPIAFQWRYLWVLPCLIRHVRARKSWAGTACIHCLGFVLSYSATPPVSHISISIICLRICCVNGFKERRRLGRQKQKTNRKRGGGSLCTLRVASKLTTPIAKHRPRSGVFFCCIVISHIQQLGQFSKKIRRGPIVYTQS